MIPELVPTGEYDCFSVLAGTYDQFCRFVRDHEIEGGKRCARPIETVQDVQGMPEEVRQFIMAGNFLDKLDASAILEELRLRGCTQIRARG